MKSILNLLPVFLMVATAAAADSRPPNALFIAVDDLNDWVGCLDSHPQVKTPNIDALEHHADSRYAAENFALSRQLPKINRKPVAGSAKRILIYKDGVANWEEQDIDPNEPIPD